MKNRVLRVFLVVLTLAVQAAAGFLVVSSERQKAEGRAACAALVEQGARVQAILGQLRGAQAGLVATGQDPAEWAARLASLTRRATDTLKKIDRAALAADSTQDLVAVTGSVEAFSRLTDRVRDLLASEQPVTASSVVFGDAAQQLDTASAALASALTTQEQAVALEADRASFNEALALGAAAAWSLLVLLILLPRVKLSPEADADNRSPATNLGLALDSPPAVQAAVAAVDLDLGYNGSQGRPAPPPEPPHRPEAEIEKNLGRESSLRLNIDMAVDLAAAARLCTDLARVKESGELSGLLGRAAELLDASGIVLWMAGPDGSSLRPAASHGYSDHALGRMKTLPTGSDNAVALAYRTGQLEVVQGARGRSGAVVAPIVTPGGCAGAMAAELRHGAEASPSVQAVATIVAAQLASLVADTTPS
jgi:hypothetical protein